MGEMPPAVGDKGEERTEQRQRQRPGEPQRAKKEATRRKLLTAAHAVFERFPYSIASVDMIAEEAGVSRTTYYRHFEGKFPAALALFKDMEPQLLSQWKDILSGPEPTLQDVKLWIDNQVKSVEMDRVRNLVLRQVEVIEPEAQVHRMHYYNVILDMLWPQELLAEPGSMRKLRAKGTLLLAQFDQFLYMFGTDHPEDREALADAMAELIFSVLELRKQKITEAVSAKCR